MTAGSGGSCPRRSGWILRRATAETAPGPLPSPRSEALQQHPGAHIGLAAGIHSADLTFTGDGTLIEGACEAAVLVGPLSADGAVTLRSLTVQGELSLLGSASLEAVVLTGGAPCLTVSGTTTADALTLSDCPGTIEVSGTLTLTEPTIHIAADADAIFVSEGGHLDITGGGVSGGGTSGGAVFILRGSASFSDVDIIGGPDDDSGIVSVFEGTLTVEDSQFTESHGLMIFDSSIVTVRRTTFSQSRFIPIWSQIGDPGVPATIHLEDVTIDGVENTSWPDTVPYGLPWGVAMFYANLTAEALTVTGTDYGIIARVGVEMHCTRCDLPSAWTHSSALTLTDTTITAPDLAVWLTGSTKQPAALTLTNTTVHSGGTGLHLQGEGAVDITGSTLTGSDGDGIIAADLTDGLILTDSTLTGWRAGLLLDGSTATVTASTWADNTVDIVQQGCGSIALIEPDEVYTLVSCPEEPWDYAAP